MPGPVPATQLADTELWQDVRGEEHTLRSVGDALLVSINRLRDLGHRFDQERDELMGFLDGSKDALDRLEQWAGQAMGIDLRTSPDHVRRYLPLSVLWVVTARMKVVIGLLQDANRGLVVQHDALDEALIHLRTAMDQASQIAGGIVAANGAAPGGPRAASIGMGSASAASPSARDMTEPRPAGQAEIERQVREALRRELEDEVRTEIAAEVRRDEERRLRQELEIQLRRQLLAEIAPAMSANGALAGMEIGALGMARPGQPRAARAVTVRADRPAEVIEVFRAEAEEHLRTIASGMDRLEANPADGDAIQVVRRAVHTLKGAASITGYMAVADLAHICEDVLDRISEGTIVPSPEIVSLILDTSQALEALVEGDTAEQGGENGILAALRPRYEAILGDTLELGTTPNTGAATDSLRSVSRARPAPYEEHADDDLDREALAGLPRAIAESAQEGDLSVRLPLRKLDELITLFGDLLVNRSVVEERMGRIARMVGESIQVGERLREVGTRLDRQFETAMLPSRRPPTGQGGAFGQPRALPPPTFGGVVSGPNATHGQSGEFDPLELDRYSEFHQLSRGLTESIADAGTLNAEIETAIREMEMAMARESRMSSLFQDALLKARLVPISSLVPRLYRAIQAVAVKYNKEFELLIEGEDTEVDRGVYEDLAAPLLHLMRNAIYHGIEAPQAREAAGKPRRGQIILGARYESNQIVISIRDDGNGINVEQIRATALARGLIDAYSHLKNSEILNLIFQPGFSTSEMVTEEGGRGVGLDVVRDTITRLRGTLEVDSTVGRGSTFTLTIPISLQIQRVVLVRVSDQTYAIPMGLVEQIVQFDFYGRARMESGAGRPGTRGDQPALEVRGETYPIAHLANYLHLNPNPVHEKSPVLLLNTGQPGRPGANRWALLVDAIVGRQEIVAKSLGPHLREVPSITGATVLGNGQVLLILDPLVLLSHPLRVGTVMPAIPPSGAAPVPGVVRTPTDPQILPRGVRAEIGSPRPARPIGATDPRSLPYLLVVDDSPSVRRVVSNTLKEAGWDVVTARDGAEALEIVAKRAPAAILLDIEMPRMDGYELMATLRAQPAFAHTPLIVLTSRSATKHQQRALQLGADAYVVKPYPEEQLLATIHQLVAIRPDGSPP